MLASGAVSGVPLVRRARRAARSSLLAALARLGSLLPLRAALALGAAVAWLAWPLARATRRQMLESLAVAFPGKSPPERAAVARNSLRHLGWLAAEVVTVRRWAHRLADYVSFAGDGERVLREVLGRGRGMVYVTGHVGNWELMARRVAAAGIPNATIARAGGDPRLNALLGSLRAEGGVTTLWRDDPGTGRAMIRTFREGKALGLLIDQDTRVQGFFVPFFGRPAFTPRAAGDLALRFRAPVVVAWCRRRGDRPGDGHEVRVIEVSYDADAADREAESKRLTAACTAVLEGAIRERPEEWVWMHQRWKTRPPEGDNASSVPKSRELSAG